LCLTAANPVPGDPESTPSGHSVRMGEVPQASEERTPRGRHWSAFVRWLRGRSGTVPAVHESLCMPRGSFRAWAGIMDHLRRNAQPPGSVGHCPNQRRRLDRYVPRLRS